MQNQLFPDIELWPRERARAAKRKAHGISLHAPFNNEHAALPHMSPEEREAYLSAVEVFDVGKKQQKILLEATDRLLPPRDRDPETQSIVKNFRLELREKLLSMEPEDFQHYVELEECLGEAVGVIEQIVTAVIDRLPEKKEQEP